MPDETSLVRRAQQNDRNALEELFRINYPVLLGALVRIISDPRAAEDIAQETVLRAIVNLERYEPRAKFSTWLITIALNTRKNKLRTAWREVPSEEVFETNAEVESAEERALRHLAMDEAASLLDALGPEKRQVFVLKHYYGFKYQEIADAVGCPIGTVRSRLHDSVGILRREMARRGMT